MNDSESTGSGGTESGGEYTEQELLLGKKASSTIDRLCIIALVVTVAVAIFVFVSVPANTRMPYTGRWATGPLPMQIVMSLSPAALFIMWREGRKPEAHHMNKRGRIGLYVLGPVLVAGCVAGQGILAKTVLTAGGFFAG